MFDKPSVFDFLSSPMRMLEKYGAPGAIVSIILGVILMIAGVYFAFGRLAEDGYYWPAMLGLSGFGVGFVVLGSSYYLGTQRNVRRAMGFHYDRTDVEAIEQVQRSFPFWVCSACRIARDGISSADRCMECGSNVDYFEAHDEEGRRTALAMISRP